MTERSCSLMEKYDDFVLLVTEATDDSVIFEASEKPMLHKLNYTMPFNEFWGIKDIQLAVRSFDPFNEGEIVLAIDVSDWAGHEEEEYFISTVRFLYDHKEKWKYLFVLRGASEEAVFDMFLTIRQYMSGRIHKDEKWESEEKLAEYLEKCEMFTPVAADVFGKLVMLEKFDKCRSEAFIHMVAEEIRENSGVKRIGTKEFFDYAESPHGVIRLLISDEKVKVLKTAILGKEW